jgi:hypothetical protein
MPILIGRQHNVTCMTGVSQTIAGQMWNIEKFIPLLKPLCTPPPTGAQFRCTRVETALLKSKSESQSCMTSRLARRRGSFMTPSRTSFRSSSSTSIGMTNHPTTPSPHCSQRATGRFQNLSMVGRKWSNVPANGLRNFILFY